MPRAILLLAALCTMATEVAGQRAIIQYLSGTGNDHTVDWEFHIDRGRHSGEWTRIPVPSNWELQGFGVFNYGIGQNEPSDETAQYRHGFRVPADWKNLTVFLVFEGVMTDTRVKVNGQSAGPVHQGGFYRFRHEVSRLLRYGRENLLEVTVNNRSSNPSVNAAERVADYWIFGGIYRPVYLEAVPREHIDWAAIDARADGAISVRAHLRGLRQAAEIAATISTLDGQIAGEFSSGKLLPGDTLAFFSTQITQALPWSPEFPHRYRLTLQLRAGGRVLHESVETFGFRTVELRPRDGIYINGAKIMFKGVNRHSHWPSSGRTTSRALSEMDVRLIKEMNMNAVRMSHYPPDKHFVEVCDSLGLFVINELAGWQAAYDTQVGRQLVKAMVMRDVNHPSIVIWSNGNEGGFNTDLDDDYHIYDPQKRPIIHAWAQFRGTDTQHYLSYDCCANGGFHSQEVFFPTEILHGLYDGGHGAGLEDYWELMRRRPLSAGCFLWVFADEGIARVDEDGWIDTRGNYAPDGILGPYREKEGSFHTIREIWSPVHIAAPTNLASSFDGKLRVENRYHYTNLRQCRFEWRLLRFPGPLAEGDSTLVIRRGACASPDLSPGEAGWLSLELPRGWQSADALELAVTDPHGKEVFAYVFPIARPDQTLEKILPPATGHTHARETGEAIILSNDAVEVRIGKRSGLIEKITTPRGELSLRGGPALDTLLGSFPLRDISLSDDQVARARFQPDEARRLVRYEVAYQLLPSGWLRVVYEYLPAHGRYDYLGVNFSYPEEKVRGARWLGRGPYRVWKNRMRGPQLGLWEKAYNNTVTGESLWEYPEFKGYHADFQWLRLDTEEGPLLIATETPGLFFRLFTPPPPQGAFNDHTKGVFPGGDLSILHAISPIGTKFKKAEWIGPQGQPNEVRYNPDATPFRAAVYLGWPEK
jgi:hypothetical protein